MRTPEIEESLIAAPDDAQIAITFDDNRLASVLFGQYGQNLALIERRLGVVADLARQPRHAGRPARANRASPPGA